MRIFSTSDQETGPKGACVPSLGLSNKAVFSSSNKDMVLVDNKNTYPEESHFSETHMTGNKQFFFSHSFILSK